MNDKDTNETAYGLGLTAYYRGYLQHGFDVYDHESNPFPEGTEEHADWKRGWNDADHDLNA